MSSWYFVKDGERNGPMSRAELDARIAEGVVNGDTLVWRPGMDAWQKASLLSELEVPPPLLPPPLPATSFGGVGPADYASDTAAASASGWGAPATAAATNPPRYAGFGIRLGAKLIDCAVFYGIGAIVERAVIHLLFDGVMPLPPDWDNWLRLVMWTSGINTLIGLIYTMYFVYRYEGTPGKRLLGLRIVRSDGGRLGMGRIVGRHFAETLSTITFFAGYVMAAFDEEKRTLHDYMCDTRVVRGPREDER